MSEYYPPVKPGSITAIQVIAWIKVGLLSLGLCAMGFLSSQVGADVGAEVTGVLALVMLLFAVFLIAFVVIAVNIPKGREWARIMAIVVEAINLASVPFLLFGSLEGSASGGSIVGVILSIIVIVSATKPESRRYCQEMSH